MADKKFDFKKEYKDLYLPKEKPAIIEVPPMRFIMAAGSGNPNSEGGQYSQSMEILYGLSWTIKMSRKSGTAIEGFFEYTVPPLEGLWWLEDFTFDGQPIANKDDFFWISMIRQPDFVTQDTFEWAKEALLKKKPHLDFEHTRFETFEEGLCAQIMHTGPYDDESATVAELDRFIKEQGLSPRISDDIAAFPVAPRHHELYISDPFKTKPENLKTVIRHPVR